MPGVHGVMSFTSRFFAGLHLDLYYLSGPTGPVTLAVRDVAPYPPDADVVLDAPFDGITPLDYSFADRIRASDLPATLDTDTVGDLPDRDGRADAALLPPDEHALEDLDWIPMSEGGHGKILRVCPETGVWTVMFKQEAGSSAPPHKHLAAAEFYVLEGCIEYRGGVAKAGHFAREPMGAVHERTFFPEDTLYLFTSYGPLAMYGPEGNIVAVTDAELIHSLLEAQGKGGA